MRAFIPDLESKLTSFGIRPKFHGDFRALVEQGTPPSHELGVRLATVKNYQTCLDSLMAELSRPVIEKHFSAAPPVDHFEPLEITP